jgi:3-oxoacyl-[acyl-carrier protein] reductase
VTRFEPAGRSLAGKVAVVTGSGQGIGAAIARLLAAEGAVVVTNSRHQTSDDGTRTAADTAADITQAGGTAIPVFADAGTEEGSRRLMESAVTTFGPIHVLVNNAGGGAQPGGTAISKPLSDITLQEWVEALRSNTTSQFLCTQLVVPHMIAAGWGRVVNMGSTAGLLGFPNMSSYAAAKAASTGFTLAMAKELIDTGVTVNCILPSAATVRSERNRAVRERMSGIRLAPDPNRTPEAIAPLVLYLCGDGASDVTGQLLFCGGGRITLYRWPPPATTILKSGTHWTADELDQAFSRHFQPPLLPPPADV